MGLNKKTMYVHMGHLTESLTGFLLLLHIQTEKKKKRKGTVGNTDVSLWWIWLQRDHLWGTDQVWTPWTSWICQVKMELWKSVATPEDYPSMRPPEVASHSFGGFVCGLLCGCVIISNGIMFPLSTIHCKTTQLVNKTVMNFSELYFSRCLLKRQKLLLRVFMLFKCNWLFTISIVFFFFWMVSFHYIFVIHLFSLRTTKHYFQNFPSHCIEE